MGREAGPFLLLSLLFQLPQMTVADLRVAFLVRQYKIGAYGEVIPKTILDAFPRLLGVYEAVFAQPSVRGHMDKEKATW